MDKAVKEKKLGGWLGFVFVVNCIMFALIAGMFLLVLVVLPQAPNSIEALTYYLPAFELGITGFLLFKFLQFVKTAEENSPMNIVKLMVLIFITGAAFLAVELYLYKFHSLFNSDEILESAKGVFQCLVWLALWSSYFEKSERVKKYYGQNFLGWKELEFAKLLIWE